MFDIAAGRVLRRGRHLRRDRRRHGGRPAHGLRTSHRPGTARTSIFEEVRGVEGVKESAPSTRRHRSSTWRSPTACRTPRPCSTGWSAARSSTTSSRSWPAPAVASPAAASRIRRPGCTCSIPSWPGCAPRPCTPSTRSKSLRKSHENPAIERLYEDFLGSAEQPPVPRAAAHALRAQVPARCEMSPQASRTRNGQGPRGAARARRRSSSTSAGTSHMPRATSSRCCTGSRTISATCRPRRWTRCRC